MSQHLKESTIIGGHVITGIPGTIWYKSEFNPDEMDLDEDDPDEMDLDEDTPDEIDLDEDDPDEMDFEEDAPNEMDFDNPKHPEYTPDTCEYCSGTGYDPLDGGQCEPCVGTGFCSERD